MGAKRILLFILAAAAALSVAAGLSACDPDEPYGRVSVPGTSAQTVLITPAISEVPTGSTAAPNTEAPPAVVPTHVPPITAVPTAEPLEGPVRAEITVEAGTELPDAAEWFSGDPAGDIRYGNISSVNTRVPGKYDMTILLDGVELSRTVRVVDTTPPSLTVHDVTVWKGDRAKATDFVKSIADLSGTDVSFKEQVATDTPGKKRVVIVAEDEYGNRTEAETVLYVIVDETPPVIEAEDWKEIYLGDGFSYRAGVSARDNRDGPVEFSVDSSRVNLRAVGTYEIIYTATDAAGNTARKTVTLAVRPQPVYTEEAMREMYSELASRLLNDGMDDVEKLFVIWNYISTRIFYSGYSDKSDWIREAIRGVNEQTGDCFTYFAAMKAFLEAAGFETADVVRKGGETKHFWSMVKVGGEWYHIDACERSTAHLKYWFCFLRTDEELLNFGIDAGCNYYYQFDTSLYPESGKESIACAEWDADNAQRVLVRKQT